MSAVLNRKMDVDEFLAWAESQEGRYELEAGELVAMAPERALHARTKFEAAKTLDRAIRDAAIGCTTYVDSLRVRIGPKTSYEPDVLVQCGEQPGDDEFEAGRPVIVVEVLSSSTAYRDLSVKLSGYFTVPSLHHYLILDADQRLVIHHQRGEDGSIVTRLFTEGQLHLDPPGVTVAVSDMLVPAETE